MTELLEESENPIREEFYKTFNLTDCWVVSIFADDGTPLKDKYVRGYDSATSLGHIKSEEPITPNVNFRVLDIAEYIIKNKVVDTLHYEITADSTFDDFVDYICQVCIDNKEKMAEYIEDMYFPKD